MPGPLHVNQRVEIAETELKWRFSRSSGPGGQSVNTADSRVELSFDVERSPSLPEFLRVRAVERLGDRLVDGVVTVVASENRSQWSNRLAAERRLAEVLRKALAPPRPPRRPTKPTKAAKHERIEDKRRRGDIKRARRNPMEED